MRVFKRHFAIKTNTRDETRPSINVRGDVIADDAMINNNIILRSTTSSYCDQQRHRFVIVHDTKSIKRRSLQRLSLENHHERNFRLVDFALVDERIRAAIGTLQFRFAFVHGWMVRIEHGRLRTEHDRDRLRLPGCLLHAEFDEFQRSRCDQFLHTQRCVYVHFGQRVASCRISA